MTYKIKFKKEALKFLKSQNKSQQIRILNAIYNLPIGDIKKMSGLTDVYRLRIGNIRVIYEIDNGELIIIVLDIGNRGDIYKKI